jgi:hypothetical protein
MRLLRLGLDTLRDELARPGATERALRFEAEAARARADEAEAEGRRLAAIEAQREAEEEAEDERCLAAARAAMERLKAIRNVCARDIKAMHKSQRTSASWGPNG